MKVEQVNKENLRKLCWLAGYNGIVGLAKSLDRNPVTIHRAVRWPDQYGPTYRLILKALTK
jgi:hypothetical protein